MPYYIEDEYAAIHGLTLEEWKKKGKELVEQRDKNNAECLHPYRGISDSDADILDKYEEYVAGVFI